MSRHADRVRRLLGAAIALPVLVAACGTATVTPIPSPSASPPVGSPSSAPSVAPSGSPASGADLLLEVTTEGGFINPSATLAALPTVVVYRDGRILTQGMPDTAVSDPLLPTIQVHDVGTTGAKAIQDAIDTAGLDKASTAEPGVSADTGVDIFTVPVDGGLITTRFAANGPGRPGQPGGGDPGASVDPERAAAFELLTKLLDPAETWGVASALTSDYTPRGYRIFVAPLAPQTGEIATVPWPLSTDLAAFGTAATPDRGVPGLRSGVVLGADAATLAPVLATTSVGTAFTSAGTAYTIWVRPLLPHELPA